MGSKKQRNKTNSIVASVVKPQKGRGKEHFFFLAPFSLFLLGFLLYGKTLSFGYVLDDEMVITKNIHKAVDTSGSK